MWVGANRIDVAFDMRYEKERGIKEDFKVFFLDKLVERLCCLLKWGGLLRCGVGKEK